MHLHTFHNRTSYTSRCNPSSTLRQSSRVDLHYVITWLCLPLCISQPIIIIDIIDTTIVCYNPHNHHQATKETRAARMRTLLAHCSTRTLSLYVTDSILNYILHFLQTYRKCIIITTHLQTSLLATYIIAGIQLTESMLLTCFSPILFYL